MSKEKLTDEQIVKSLENCFLNSERVDMCCNCKYNSGHTSCEKNLIKDSLNLINQLKKANKTLNMLLSDSEKCGANWEASFWEIGDDREEWKHKAEVLERALENVIDYEDLYWVIKDAHKKNIKVKDYLIQEAEEELKNE